MEVIFTNMRSFKLKTLIILLSVLIPPIVFAVNITVPAAPGSGYFLYSTSTGAYVYHASSTAATDFGITSSQWTTGASSSIYYNLGNVGIGTSSPATTLDVNGSSTIRGNQYFPSLGSSGALVLTTNGLVATSTYLANNSGDWAGTWQTHSPSYFQTALGFTPLNPANNLSDVSNTSTALSNLGGQTNLNGAYVSSFNGATGTATYNITAGTGISVSTTTSQGTITNTGVTSLNGATGSVAIVAGTNVTISTSSTSTTINASGGGTPAGTSTNVQFNNGGAFGADNDFSYNSSTKNLTLTNVSSSLRIGKSSNFGLSQTSTMVTYNYTGATSSFIVPSTVSSITISATGGGGSGSTSGEGGGQAGQVTGTLSVVAGETIYFFVGGEGSTTSPGLPGGGSGYSGAGGGGGFTWVSTSSSLSTSTVILVAAGGGGGGLHSTSGVGGGGGLGGGLSGTAGGNGSTGSAGGGPGTQINGGAPGSQNAATGTIFEGGSGESRSSASGGGGGGGWYGGGGGGSDGITGGGGGGGSSYLSSLLTNTSTATGTASTPGNLTFTYYSGSFYQLPNVSIGQHIITGGVGTTTVSSCGTSPSIVGNDTAGVVTTGSGTVTSCVVNFGSSWPNPPVCIVSDNLTSITPDISSTTLTSVTFGFSSTLTSGKVYYQCLGY